MPESKETQAARAIISVDGTALDVALGGAWLLEGRRPRWEAIPLETRPTVVRIRAEGLERWDSSILLFVEEISRWCDASGIPCERRNLPPRLLTLLDQLAGSVAPSPAFDRSAGFAETVGESTQHAMRQVVEILQFVGECTTSAVRVVVKPAAFRWGDCVAEMQECGAKALPIVSLISFLVGVTMAYSGAEVLRRFGGDIYIADILGVAMTREMGALMAAVVMSGRTGAAFAAQIGSMKANEEIDALSVLGIAPVRFLVLPRIVALAVMMPLLAIYANCLGIVGGMVVARGILDIAPEAFWSEMLTIVDLLDVSAGVIKAVAFGLIVGLSGCLRGLQAERNASGVGRSATSAVVTAILLIIVADAVFAVIFQTIGL